MYPCGIGAGGNVPPDCETATPAEGQAQSLDVRVGMYEIRQNTLNEHKYIVWCGAVPSGFKYPSSKMEGKPAQFIMRLQPNGELHLFVVEDQGKSWTKTPVLLKRFIQHNIDKDDFESMYKLGQQFLRQRPIK